MTAPTGGADRKGDPIMSATLLGTATDKDEEQLWQLLADQESAMRTGDADLLVSRYAPEAVAFTLAPPLAYAGTEVSDPERMRRWFAGFDGPVHFNITEPELTVGGEVAFCHSINRMGAVPVGAPDGFEMWFRATVCFARVGGEWKVTHEHASTPFYMDGSFRAAVDLKP